MGNWRNLWALWDKPAAASRRRATGPDRRRGSRQRSLTGTERLEARWAMAAAPFAELPDALPRFDTVEQVEQFLVAKALDDYAAQFGQPAYPYYYLMADTFGGPLALRNSTGEDFSGAPASAHSTTNVQVEGVDEADMVETDGQWLYVLRDSELVIADAHSADSLAEVSRYDFPGIAAGEFLAGDRLTIVSTDWHGWGVDPLFGRVAVDALPFSPSLRSRPTVTVTVLDVADPAAPRLVEQSRFDGSLVDSRAIGDKVFVLLSNADLTLPPPQIVCADRPPGDKSGEEQVGGEEANAASFQALRPLPWEGDPGKDCRYEDQATYLARIGEKLDSIVDGLLPHYTSWDDAGQFVRGGVLHEPGDIVRPLNDQTSQLLSVVALNVADDQSGPVAAEAIPTAWNSAVMASAEHLYVFQSTYREGTSGASTDILKFNWDVASGEIRAVAQGAVPGTTLNQFSADEQDGRLRIATTQRRFDENRWISDNGVYVLEELGTSLTVVGAVTGLARGESIRSVRFAGDRGYVVTFEQIDPLFTLDLSDPRAPHVAGELKIPGFSSYLQVLDDNRVLGLGRVPGEGGRWNVQVSLFDVSDMAQPQRVGSYTFDDTIWSSAAEWEHHAVTWIPALDMLAIPVAGSYFVPPRAGEDPWPLESTSRSGLALLRIGQLGSASPLPAVTLTALVPQEAVQRSVWIDDVIYSLSPTEILAIAAVPPHDVLGRLVWEETSTDPGGPDPSFPPVVWFGGGTVVDPSIALPETSPGDPRESPSPWDDQELKTALQQASTLLAQQLGDSVDQLRLVTAERVFRDGTSSNSGPPTGQFQLVFGAGDRHYRLRAETGEKMEVELLDADFAFPSAGIRGDWHNASRPCDVDGDGIIAPLDGLIVINEINTKGPAPLRGDRPLRSIAAELRPEFAAPITRRYLFDSSRDDLLSPLDVLLIINQLNEAPARTGSGEGEAAWAPTSLAPSYLTSPTAARDTASSLASVTPSPVGVLPAVATPDRSDGAVQDAALLSWSAADPWASFDPETISVQAAAAALSADFGTVDVCDDRLDGDRDLVGS